MIDNARFILLLPKFESYLVGDVSGEDNIKMEIDGHVVCLVRTTFTVSTLIIIENRNGQIMLNRNCRKLRTQFLLR